MPERKSGNLQKNDSRKPRRPVARDLGRQHKIAKIGGRPYILHAKYNARSDRNIFGKINACGNNVHDFCPPDDDNFHPGTLDAVYGNFSAPSGRGSPLHSLGTKPQDTLE